MGIWNSTLVYVGARTLLAGAMVALLLRRRVGPWYAGGQVVSDLSCAAFLLAYVNADIRDEIGVLVVPLLLFVLYWEAMRLLDNRRAAALSNERESWFDGALRLYGMVWVVGFVLPGVLAGGFLIFDLLAPAQWPFPNPRPLIACEPRRLGPRTALTVRLQTPHGGELTVVTPARHALIVVPHGSGFRDVERFVLATDTVSGRVSAGSRPERVFADTGVYMVIVSEETELSASRTCRVRYAT